MEREKALQMTAVAMTSVRGRRMLSMKAFFFFSFFCQ